jgi:hypothetical protein
MEDDITYAELSRPCMQLPWGAPAENVDPMLFVGTNAPRFIGSHEPNSNGVISNIVASGENPLSAGVCPFDKMIGKGDRPDENSDEDEILLQVEPPGMPFKTVLAIARLQLSAKEIGAPFPLLYFFSASH